LKVLRFDLLSNLFFWCFGVFIFWGKSIGSPTFMSAAARRYGWRSRIAIHNSSTQQLLAGSVFLLVWVAWRPDVAHTNCKATLQGTRHTHAVLTKPLHGSFSGMWQHGQVGDDTAQNQPTDLVDDAIDGLSFLNHFGIFAFMSNAIKAASNVIVCEQVTQHSQQPKRHKIDRQS
jgi:hypothetical protein